MYFNSITFFVFLPIVFWIFWKVSAKSERFGKLILLISSYIFYGWWDWRFLILIIFSSATDFILGQKIFTSKSKKQKKFLLATSIFVNIGILFIFKYFNFFIDSFETLFGITPNEENWSTLNVILPVGISFYTFQTLSYSIDIFRQKTKPTKSALTFFTFVAFFPQLVAGPIERARKLIPQFEKKPVFSFTQSKSGLKLMLWGFFKKMVIADQLSIIVDVIFANPENFNGISIVIATFLFGFQIYCDFSGYSDIAIGIARLFGIELMTNFRTPYFATSFRDFWHRWHISLSTWFRDYIYIPLGGNKTTSFIWARNIIITFTISGLWHGANITFVLWGLVHGLLFILERYISPLIKLKNNIRKIGGLIVTYLLVNSAWVLFRAESWTHLKSITNSIFSSATVSKQNLISVLNTIEIDDTTTITLYIILPIFLIIEIVLGKKEFSTLFSNSPKLIRWAFYYIVVLSILFFGVLNSAPQFIYFQF